MNGLTRQQERVKRKLFERPQSLTDRDGEVLYELFTTSDETTRIEVLEVLRPVFRDSPDLPVPIKDIHKSSVRNTDASRIECHRAENPECNDGFLSKSGGVVELSKSSD